MTMKEFVEFTGVLKKAYNEPWFLPDADDIDFWYAALADIPFDVAKNVAIKCASTREEPPKIATIRRMAAEMTATPEESMNAQEAWSLVTKALRNSTYGFEKEFAALPEAVQKAVGSASNLHDWGQISDPESMTVIQSQFQRAYRQVEERRKSEAALPVLDTLSRLNISTQNRIEAIG